VGGGRRAVGREGESRRGGVIVRWRGEGWGQRSPSQGVAGKAGKIGMARALAV